MNRSEMTRKQIPAEALIRLEQRLATLPPRSAESRRLIEETAHFYDVSSSNLYRMLREHHRPRAAFRSDRGKPRKLSSADMQRYCEIIAAMKERTSNKKGRHLSTGRAIELLEEHGIHTPDGFVQPPTGLLSKPTVNRYLKSWGYDRQTLTRESPFLRFQAEFSNDCWQFDLSPSDLKHLQTPPDWVDLRRGNPLLMLYSIVDDRSGVCYQEYHCVYGEDVEAALRFLFNSMSAKSIEGFPLQGIPKMLYMDNGPIARSRVFLNVMEYLGVQVVTHSPSSKEERKTAARAKGKVERPFRTVKEAHETLYHFHQPESEAEANLWLHNYLLNYNNQQHREEPHSRFEDWLMNLPAEGIRQMCSWERFCTFAREPERRKVGNDARVTIDGAAYEVDAELAGETVILWWGLFDNQLFVEFKDDRYGPFYPAGGAIPLHKYRKFKKTKQEERAERIAALAKKLDLPRSTLEGNQDLEFLARLANESNKVPLPSIEFQDPDPYQEFTYPNVLLAKRAVAEHLGMSLTKLLPAQRAFIDQLLAETLNKKVVMERVKDYFQPSRLITIMSDSVEDKEDKYVN